MADLRVEPPALSCTAGPHATDSATSERVVEACVLPPTLVFQLCVCGADSTEPNDAEAWYRLASRRLDVILSPPGEPGHAPKRR